MTPLIALVVLAGGLAGQDPASACEDPAFDAVSFLLGTWEVRSWVRDSEGGWLESSARSSITSRLDGCVIEEVWQGSLYGRPLRQLSLLVYDGGEGKWDLAQVDTGHGNLNLMQGRVANGRLVLFHNEYRGGRLLIDRTTMTPTPGGFDWVLESSADAGETWRSVWRMEYRRP